MYIFKLYSLLRDWPKLTTLKCLKLALLCFLFCAMYGMVVFKSFVGRIIFVKVSVYVIMYGLLDLLNLFEILCCEHGVSACMPLLDSEPRLVFCCD